MVCVCGSVNGLCLCVWLCCWFNVCVCVCGCGDGFGYVDWYIMGVCVLCVEPVLEIERERGIKIAIGKLRKMRLKNSWKEIIKRG